MSNGTMCLTCRAYIGPESWHCKCVTPVPSEDGKTPSAPNHGEAMTALPELKRYTAVPNGASPTMEPCPHIGDQFYRCEDVDALLALDEPWPLRDVLDKLRAATQHLLDVHSCDTHGHEEFKAAMMQAETLIVRIDEAMKANT